MAKPVHGDGKVDEAMRIILDNFNQYNKNDLEILASGLDKPVVAGGRPRGDQCKLGTLIKFADHWGDRFGAKTPIPKSIGRWTIIKYKQAHVGEIEPAEETTDGSPPRPDILGL